MLSKKAVSSSVTFNHDKHEYYGPQITIFQLCTFVRWLGTDGKTAWIAWGKGPRTVTSSLSWQPPFPRAIHQGGAGAAPEGLMRGRQLIPSLPFCSPLLGAWTESFLSSAFKLVLSKRKGNNWGLNGSWGLLLFNIQRSSHLANKDSSKPSVVRRKREEGAAMKPTYSEGDLCSITLFCCQSCHWTKSEHFLPLSLFGSLGVYRHTWVTNWAKNRERRKGLRGLHSYLWKGQWCSILHPSFHFRRNNSNVGMVTFTNHILCIC